MTVSFLWNVLDESNCGIPVGIECFPLRDDARGRRGTFAVDTSIWICEAIASTALSSFHSDPALYLIYQRTTKLLTLGFRLIMVLEGNRRVLSNDGGQELRKRRSGSHFFAATTRCEALLRMLGVPVVRAEAEGEALCALLSEKGIVDAVISNDADCFLYGAKCVYTKFTLEGLENRTVMRYDADRLKAAVPGSNNRSITLSRCDLVAFSLLTGSDMTSGVSHVGHKKAITFIDSCITLTQQPDDRTCLDKLLAWDKEANRSTETQTQLDDDGSARKRTCSVCLHKGSKDLHAKNGCAQCGTTAGEGCYVVTAIEKTVMTMYQKIATMQHQPFRTVVDAYFSPNDNIIPSTLASFTPTTCIASPNAAQLFQSTLILKGSSLSSSRDYVRQTLPPLLARLDLLSTAPRNVYATISNQKYKPIPIRIEKKAVQKSVPSYEVIWAIVIDCNIEQQVHFSTHEFQTLINAAFPRLVETFHREERKKQRGLIEQERRRKFVGTNQQQREKQLSRSMKPGHGRKRERHFDDNHFRKPRMTSTNLAVQSNDVTMLMNHMPATKTDATHLTGDEGDSWTNSYRQNLNDDQSEGDDQDSIADTFPYASDAHYWDDSLEERDSYDISLPVNEKEDSACDEGDFQDNTHDNSHFYSHFYNHSEMPALSPNRERIYCNLGIVVECTPIRRRNI